MNTNRIESPEMNPLIYCQLIFDKAAKTLFSINGTGTTRYPHVKEMKLNPYIMLYTNLIQNGLIS